MRPPSVPKMARLGPPFLSPNFPLKEFTSLRGFPCCLLSQEMRHINLFQGVQNGALLVGGKEFMLKKSMCFFRPLQKSPDLFRSSGDNPRSKALKNPSRRRCRPMTVSELSAPQIAHRHSLAIFHRRLRYRREFRKWAIPPVRLALSGRNSGKIPERPRKRSQSVSWNSRREHGWDAPNSIIQGI